MGATGLTPGGEGASVKTLVWAGGPTSSGRRPRLQPQAPRLRACPGLLSRGTPFPQLLSELWGWGILGCVVNSITLPFITKLMCSF